MTFATKILASAILLAIISPAQASYLNEAEPNDTLAQAQSMDSYFSMNYDADIGDVEGINRSTTMAHASVLATGDNTFDYYSFTLSRESTVILDIDYGMQDFDSVIRIMIETKQISLEDGLSYATNQNNLLLQLKGLASTEDYVNPQKSRRMSMPEPIAPPPPAPVKTTSVLDMME